MQNSSTPPQPDTLELLAQREPEHEPLSAPSAPAARKEANPAVLLVAFHFPPQRGSSGIQRTLKFSQHLPQLGWKPLVLSAHRRAYAASSDDQMGDVPADLVVRRPFALDSGRHLAIRGRYLRPTALPDRWVTWLFGAVPAGLKLIREFRPRVIWSTYPIPTAHLIGYTLKRLSGLPWIADMRDPMTEKNTPENRMVWHAYRWVEKLTVRNCTRLVFTTPGALALYRARYPEVPASRFRLIENGYDEDDFVRATANYQPAPRGDGPLVLLHSGIIYPLERDPTPMLAALGELRREGLVGPDKLRVVLRAAVHEDLLNRLIEQFGLQGLVMLEPPIPYRAALAEMLDADGLLVMQAAHCNAQIPAKLYEYMRARRPILALTDPEGDTAATMRKAGLDTIARLDDKEDIKSGLMRFVGLLREGKAPLPPENASQFYSRRSRSEQLAALLDEVVQEGARA
ncbi:MULTISPECIES: glycosyltransferase [unclassified Massilia]|uniref:glycosyltransferase n=1 Tax=unclassified Massilia TaxID=2609279 RepID=UPI001E4B269B|nr:MULTISPECIES: glycosyltransferase [unclassified Massilia]